MTAAKLDWQSNEGLAVGKGATIQEFVAMRDGDKLEIDVAPWGKGHLKVNGREIAHVDDAKDRHVGSCHDIFHRLAVGRKRDNRLEFAVTVPTAPYVMDLALISILCPFGSDQLTPTLDTVRNQLSHSVILCVALVPPLNH